MGIFDWIKNIIAPPPPPPDSGTIYIKPEEKEAIGTPSVPVSIPATGETYTPSGGWVAPTTPTITDPASLVPYDPSAPTRRTGVSPATLSPPTSISPSTITPPDVTIDKTDVRRLEVADVDTKVYDLPATVSLADPSRVSERPYSMGDDLTFGEKIRLRFAKYKDPVFWKTVVSTPFAGGMGTEYATVDYPNILASLSLLYPSLPERYRGRKGDVEIPDIPYSGTKVYDPATKKYSVPDPYKGKTEWGAIQEQQIRAKGIEAGIQKGVEEEVLPKYQKQFEEQAKFYQTKIDVGKLPLGEAERLFALSTGIIQTQYSTEAGELFQKRLKEDPTYAVVKDWEQRYEKASQFKPDIGKSIFTAGVLVAGTFVAPVTTGAVIATSGIQTGYKSISEKEYLKAGISFSIAGLGIYGSMRAVSSQLTKLQIEDVLATKPKMVYASRVYSKGLYTDFYQSMSKTPLAYSYTKGTVVSKLRKGKAFEILGGRADTIVLTRDVWTGKPLIVGASQKILTSGGRFYSAYKGFVPSKFDLVTSQKYSYSTFFGKSGLEKIKTTYYTSKISTTQYGGISKTFRDRILSFSGRSKEYVKTFRVKGMKGVSDKGYTFDVGTVGITKIVDISKLTRGISFRPFDYAGLDITTPQTGVSSILRTVQKFQPPVITPLPSVTQIYRSAGAISKLSGGVSAVLTIPRQDVSIIQKQKLPQVIVQAPKLMQRQLQIQVVRAMPSFAVAVDMPPAIVQAQAQFPRLTQRQRMMRVPKLITLAPTTPSLKISFPFSPAGVPPFIPRLPRGMKEAGLGKRRVEVRRIVKYIPSFSAIIAGITGKKPRGIETGLRVRPITKATKDIFAFYRKYTPRKRIIKKKKVKRR